MPFLEWVEATGLATWVRESPSIWSYPTILTLHTLGLGIVVGGNVVVDLRLLGYGTKLELSSLTPIFRIVAWAFLLNFVTGVLLFMSAATQKGLQPVFYIKLTFIALALWNTVLVRRYLVRETGPAGLSRRRGARLGVTSMVLWTGAIVAGRLMAYL
jgi:hypothetical protein